MERWGIVIGGAEYLDFGEDSAWACYGTGLSPKAKVWVRFAEQESGRLSVTEVHVAVGDGVGSDLLRSLPLGRIENAVNTPRNAAQVRRRLSAKDLGVVTALEQRAPWEGHPLAGFVQYVGPRLRLEIPKGRKRPDDFYEQVAEAYGWLAGKSRSPAADLAKANDVPVTTIHRWVKEARRRGLLASGRRESMN